MAREVYTFAVTVPAGTLKTAPQVTALTMPERVIAKLSMVIPPGPRGVVGFQFSSGGQQLLPINAGAFIVTDDEKPSWDLSGYLTTGAWQITAYNTGGQNHTLYIRFEADPLPDPAAAMGPQPLPVEALGGVG